MNGYWTKSGKGLDAMNASELADESAHWASEIAFYERAYEEFGAFLSRPEEELQRARSFFQYVSGEMDRRGWT